MYESISASAEIKWKDRKKLKRWVMLDEGGEFSHISVLGNITD